MFTVYASVANLPLGQHGAEKVGRRIKFVTDKDCLPSNARLVREFVSTGSLKHKADRSERFWKFYDHARFMEQLGMDVCIDFGDYFYETGGEVDIK